MSSLTVVGKDIPGIGVKDKATGKAVYGVDLKLPGMLHAKVLHSNYPHAKILNIDTSKAEKLPGVKKVITADNMPHNTTGFLIMDKPVMAKDRARYIGEMIAAVAAVDPDVAEEALDLIQVDYEVLPAVFDPEEAIKPGAPLIHPDKDKYWHADYLHPVKEKNNILTHFKLRHGDIQEGFRSSDHIFEDKYRTHFTEHASMEPHVVLADFDTSGRLSVWTSTQAATRIRQQLAPVLKLPMSKLRVIQPITGGGFGGKIEITLEPICSVLSILTGKPVKSVYAREQEFIASTVRHPFVVYVKLGVKKDGALMALEMTFYLDNGAYSNRGEGVSEWALICANGPYSIPNVKMDAYCVYTNNIYGGAVRGFGNPQVSFARESLIDKACAQLKIDPVEFRLRNAWDIGSVTATGQVFEEGKYGVGVKDTIRQAAEKINWRDKPRPVRRGKGLASMYHGSGYAALIGTDSSGCFVKINDDGTASLIAGAVDIGQGSDTIMAQIVAEELGITVDKVAIHAKDTDAIPHDGGTSASRVTYLAGNAALYAARDVKRQLLRTAADKLEANPDDLEAKDGQIYVKGAPGRSISLADTAWIAIHVKGAQPMGHYVFRMGGGSLREEDHQGTPFVAYLYATQAAEVEVDEETGKVEVLRLVAAHDVGKAINPAMVAGQIYGAVVTGVGYALTEEICTKDGYVLNPNFMDYKMLTALDLPRIEPVIVESYEPSGPYGAKGVGEPGLVATAPAIANAIYDAVGVRIKDLPISPEKVLKALKEKKAKF